MAKNRRSPDRSLPVPGDKPAAPLKLITDLRELIEELQQQKMTLKTESEYKLEGTT